MSPLQLSAVLVACLLVPTSSAQEGARPGPPPEPERGVRRALEGAGGGATLVAPLRSRTTYLVDAAGETLHSWPSEWTPGNSAYLMEDGSLLRCGKDAGTAPYRGGGEGGRIQRIGWDGELMWDHQLANSRRRQHHDIEPLPNGNVLAIVWEGVSTEDAIAAGRDADSIGDRGIWPDAILELKPVGASEAEVVWEWHAWDHLVQDRDPEKPNYGAPAAHPHRINVNFDRRERPPTAAEREREAAEQERLRGLGYGGGGDEPRRGRRGRGGRGGRGGSDWMHTNGIDYDPATDLIAISVRSASEVWFIDHSTTTDEARTGEGGRRGRGGDLLHRFGRPASFGAEGEQVLFHQHDPQFLPSAGAILLSVFNNGSGRPGGDRSSADVFKIPFTEDAGFGDGPLAQPELAWTWDGGDERFFNGHISGVQRLGNGNTLVCLGEVGRVLEVSADHRVVWEYLQDFKPDEGPNQGGPPRGRRDRGGPPGGGPPRGGPPGGRPGGGGPRSSHAIFRASRYEADHPGLARVKAKAGPSDR